jgi:hypothetical protein
MEAKQKGKVPMNKKPHGQLTAETALHLSQYLVNRGYDVLFDHSDSSNENVGRIVSWFGDHYVREAELSQIDIAIVEKSSDKAFVLIEIEETNDKPKALLGDALCVLMGEHICFGGKYEISVDERTTLIILGKSEIAHEKRNRHLREKVMEIKSGLSTVNSVIGNVVIETFSDEKGLDALLSSCWIGRSRESCDPHPPPSPK